MSVEASAALRSRQSVAVSPLPPPEEIFIDWLMSVPPDDCLEAAARFQIELIDARGWLHPGVQCLRTLLAAVAGASGSDHFVPSRKR